MGEMLGIPEWLALVLWLVACFALYFVWAYHSLRKARHQLAAKRPNPTLEEFIAMMRSDVDEDIARWIWDQSLPYFGPLTPYPDDHLMNDARIHDDDVSMYWLPDFAKSQGLSHKDWPDWPEDWDLTVRNFARWLQVGRQQLAG